MTSYTLYFTLSRQERLGTRSEPFGKGKEGRFARNGRADEHNDKIDEIVMAKACLDEPHLFLDRFPVSCVAEDLSKGCHFSRPAKDRGFGRNLDRY